MSPTITPPNARMDDMSALLAKNWWAMLLRGFAAVVFGVLALLAPGAVLLSLAWLFAAYLLVDGAFAILASMRAAAAHERWGLLLAEGVLDLAMAIAAALFPAAAVLAFVVLTGIWAVLTGGLMLGAAFGLHISHGRWWLAFGGVVSIAWGVLLLVAPMMGAVVLTWWLGAYAIVFGCMLLMLGFRLRGRHTRAA